MKAVFFVIALLLANLALAPSHAAELSTPEVKPPSQPVSAASNLPAGAQLLGTLYWNYMVAGPDGIEAPGDYVRIALEYPNPAHPEFPHDPAMMVLKVSSYSVPDCQLKLRAIPGPQTDPPTLVQDITAHHYAIVGEVKYDFGDKGNGGRNYLEMLSYFPSPGGGPERMYFSRTLAETGPMASLSGHSGWRFFELPFDSTGSPVNPSRLELNLHFNGIGDVWLRNMKLIQYPEVAAPTVRLPATTDNHVAEWVIGVTSNSEQGTIYTLNATAYSSLAAIQEMIANAHKSNPKLALIIRADRNVPYPEITRLLDAIKNAGVQSVSFATLRDSSPAETTTVTSVGVDPAQALAPKTSGKESRWAPFLLGILFTIFLLAGGRALFFIMRRLARRRHERELRRMASLDS